LHQPSRQLAACTELCNSSSISIFHPQSRRRSNWRRHWDDGDLASLEKPVEYLNRQYVPSSCSGPIVQYASPLPRLLAMSISHKDPDLPRRLDKTVSTCSIGDGRSCAQCLACPVTYLLFRFLLADQCTSSVAPDVPLLSDYGHLTKMGSVFWQEGDHSRGSTSWIAWLQATQQTIGSVWFIRHLEIVETQRYDLHRRSDHHRARPRINDHQERDSAHSSNRET